MGRMVWKGCALLVVAAGLAASSAAWAGPEVEGIGVVWQKDAARRTVTIGSVLYQVGPDTLLEGRSGEQLGFAMIPVAREEAGRVLGMRGATVAFEAFARGGRLYLQRLRLIEPPR